MRSGSCAADSSPPAGLVPSASRHKDSGYSPATSASAIDHARVVLRNIPWLARIHPDTLEALARSARLESHPAGTQVGWRGRRAHHFLVVVRGTVLVGFDGPDGRRHVVNLIGPGQFQSLIPLIDERPQIHDTLCKSDAVLLLIPRDAFVAALNTDPLLAWEMLRLLCTRSRRLYEALGETNILGLTTRLARILRGLFAEHGQALTIAQEELADILGATRQSINRELKRLEAEGAIALGRGRIRLVLAERLQAHCDTA